MKPNEKAFLDTIAYSELGPDLLARSDNGYNVIVGGTLWEHGYDDHPRVLVWLPHLGIHSSAAGRYQITAHNYDYYKAFLDLPDFSAPSQDAIAMQLIKECSAYFDVDDGNLEEAVYKCRSRWASFPGAGYGQRENKMAILQQAFNAAGGEIIAST